MSYAHVVDGVVQTVARQPSNLVRLDTGAKPLFSPYIDEATLNACGWYTITDPGAPTFDPAAHILEPRVAVYDAQADTVSYVYSVRAKTPAELLADQQAATRAANTATLTDLASIQTRITEIKAFLADPDIQAVLDQPNTTALTTQQTNRALKAIVRQARRDANLTLRIARYVIGQVHPALLDDITDV
jgi:hypothetical protein